MAATITPTTASIVKIQTRGILLNSGISANRNCLDNVSNMMDLARNGTGGANATLRFGVPADRRQPSYAARPQSVGRPPPSNSDFLAKFDAPNGSDDCPNIHSSRFASPRKVAAVRFGGFAGAARQANVIAGICRRLASRADHRRPGREAVPDRFNSE